MLRPYHIPEDYEGISVNANVNDRVTRLLLRPEEAAEAIAISRTKVFEMMRTGELESLTIGRSRRITADALERWVQRQSELSG